MGPPFRGEQTWCHCMVNLRDFPLNSALFGLEVSWPTFWEQISRLMEEMLRFFGISEPSTVYIWSFFKDLIGRFELIAGIYINVPGDSIPDLFIPDRWRSRFAIEGVTFSPSQKGHQQNCQVVNLHFFCIGGERFADSSLYSPKGG